MQSQVVQIPTTILDNTLTFVSIIESKLNVTQVGFPQTTPQPQWCSSPSYFLHTTSMEV